MIQSDSRESNFLEENIKLKLSDLLKLHCQSASFWGTKHWLIRQFFVKELSWNFGKEWSSWLKIEEFIFIEVKKHHYLAFSLFLRVYQKWKTVIWASQAEFLFIFYQFRWEWWDVIEEFWFLTAGETEGTKFLELRMGNPKLSQSEKTEKLTHFWQFKFFMLSS